MPRKRKASTSAPRAKKAKTAEPAEEDKQADVQKSDAVAAAAADKRSDANKEIVDKKEKKSKKSDKTADGDVDASKKGADALPEKAPEKLVDPPVKADDKQPVFNEVLTFGSGDMSQLGLGPGTRERKNPAVVKALEGLNVAAVRAGAMHNVVVLDNGSVYTWGCNDDHALGRVSDEWLPAKVPNLDDVKVTEVGCGDCHTTVLAEDGRVFSWGTFKNVAGYLGFDERTEKRVWPCQLDALRRQFVTHLASGDNHDLCVTSAGDVYEWGDTRQAKRSSERVTRTRLVPRRILIRGKLPRATGSRMLKVERVFAAGMTSFAVVRDAAAVFAWGLNNYSQDNVAVPTRIPTFDGIKVVEIAGGQHHVLGLDDQHRVYSWGRGHYGRLGHGKITGEARAALVAKGANDSEVDDKTVPTVVDALVPKALGGGDGVVSIGAGEAHSLAVTKHGHLYTWGFNELCQLGVGHDEEGWLPKKVVGQSVSGLPAGVARRVLAASGGSQHSIVLAHRVSWAAPAPAVAPAGSSASSSSASSSAAAASAAVNAAASS